MSGSRADIPDEELAQEWPFLTRQQLEEYKDAFRIFDRSGLGSFTAEDIGWVMHSLGQSPTQQQIDAIIRDMDLDNDGVIDLAEFMVRMMALTTKAAPEEDLKHVFDVLDKSGEGMITADSLRLAIKNIAEWEMTDADIEVAIKLADKSGDGRIDYDEFIAFVFGEDEPVRRVQQTGTNSVLPEHDASQIQAGPSLTPADMRQSAAQAWHLPADPLQLQRDAFQVPPDTFQASAPAFHMPAVAFEPPSSEWHGSHQQPEAEVPSTRHASQPQLAFSQHADASDVSMRPQNMTDIWVASQTEAMAASAEQQSVLQPGMVYDNALYQAEASGTSQSAAGRGQREAAQQSDCQQTVHDQTGDDMRLRVQSDDTEHDHGQQPGSQFCSQDNGYHGPPGQAGHQQSTHAGHEPEGAEAAGNSHHDSQLAEDVRLLYVARDPLDVERLSSSNVDFAQEREDSSEPGGLQATWHDGALHLSLPLEELHTADTSPTGSNASANDESQHSRRQQHTGRPAALTKVPSKPRKLPPLSHDQLSRGINRSLVSHQDSNRPQ